MADIITGWEQLHVPKLREALTAAIEPPNTIRDCEKIAVCTLQLIKAHIEEANDYNDPPIHSSFEEWLTRYWHDGVADLSTGIWEYGAGITVQTKAGMITVIINKAHLKFKSNLIIK